MSDGDAATLAELRRRIQGSFSPGELRALGTALGLEPSEAWERGGDATARDVVRRAVESGGLPALVAQLQRDKPLVEWSDLLPTAASEPDPPDPNARPTPVAPPPVLDVTPPAAAAPETGAPAPGSPPVPLAAAPASAGWPMANLQQAPEPRRGVDPRLFAITIAGIAVAVIVAFVAGIVFSRGGPAPEKAEAARSQGLAGHAANAVDAALVEVARGCGLAPPAVPGRQVLRTVLASCGHPVAVSGRPPTAVDASTIEPPELDVPPEGRPRTTPGGGGGAKTPAPPRDLCRAGCTAEHRTCKSACGSEPRDASDYAAWQSCQGKCLTGESRCRQGCK